MSQRERVVVELLRLLADGLADVREGVRGDGGSVPLRTHGTTCQLRHSGLRCSCWVRSLDELHRCLRVMRNGNRQRGQDWDRASIEVRRQWYAVHLRYVTAERRPLIVKVVRGVPNPPPNAEVIGLVNALDLDKRGNGYSRLLCEIWSEQAVVADAEAGVKWLASEFRGTPNLPKELLREAA